MRGGCVAAVAVPWLALLALARQPPEKPSAAPHLTRRPFLVAWNVPTQDCKPRFQVSFDFSIFDLYASPNEGFVGQNLTIFYKERLGLYPYYTHQGVAVNGGVPQNSSLSEHLARLQEGINKYIRSPTKEGLAVIDWEEWRPVWARNWKPKDIYREASQELVAQRQPAWPPEKVNKQAAFEFESAAQEFMVRTLRKAKSFRPKQLWGFYLFPDCYNHDYSKNKESYTGQCPDVEKSRNDQLKWLWNESMALYPSIYLDPLLDSTPNSRKFVRARVMEAMRISQKHHDDYSLPVFVYTRPTYIRKLNVLSQPDLISTIGESAALGAAGAILWGDAVDTKNRELCQLMKNYLEGDLGRYVVNVTTAAELCSTTLCQGRGRCLRQDSHADVFLHLNSTNFQLRRRDADHPERPLFWAEGQLSSADILFLRTHFHCHCYQGWQGSGCQTHAGPRSAAPGPLAPLGLGVLLLLASWCYPPLD
ncbi:PREDICTED: hyaluronidase-2 [Ficedula albicollis]|uniref:Hyaluronidase n=1 Tax=Ficedula albicollis TaxID=59894 RepID=U3K2Z2_FICAL|nr:PREDICTED: hyaluronidase-2 [Ficedula albicollis]